MENLNNKLSILGLHYSCFTPTFETPILYKGFPML